LQTTCALYNADCLSVLPTLETSSIDLVLADLPYGLSACTWDTPLDLAVLWPELRRVLKPGSPAVLFATAPFDKTLACSNLPAFKHEWIWEKNRATGHLNVKIAPLKAHENILVFCEERIRVFQPQKTQGHKPVNSYRKSKEKQIPGVYSSGSSDVAGGGQTDRFPRSVLKFGTDKERRHPTQKPLELLRYLVRTYTVEGAKVLDPTMGSGSAGKAAEAENRSFVGIEKDPAIFDQARQWLYSTPQNDRANS
jgi:site-specific DNA-methyltransferase (adenine-specific)